MYSSSFYYDCTKRECYLQGSCLDTMISPANTLEANSASPVVINRLFLIIFTK